MNRIVIKIVYCNQSIGILYNAYCNFFIIYLAKITLHKQIYCDISINKFNNI